MKLSAVEGLDTLLFTNIARSVLPVEPLRLSSAKSTIDQYSVPVCWQDEAPREAPYRHILYTVYCVYYQAYLYGYILS